MKERFLRFFINARKAGSERNDKPPANLAEVNNLCRELQLKAWGILKESGSIECADNAEYLLLRFRQIQGYENLKHVLKAEANLSTADQKNINNNILVLACPGKGLAAPVIIENFIPFHRQTYLSLAHNDNWIMKHLANVSPFTTPIPGAIQFPYEVPLGKPALKDIEMYSRLLESAQWKK
jgi:hypothetical protein